MTLAQCNRKAHACRPDGHGSLISWKAERLSKNPSPQTPENDRPFVQIRLIKRGRQERGNRGQLKILPWTKTCQHRGNRGRFIKQRQEWRLQKLPGHRESTVGRGSNGDAETSLGGGKLREQGIFKRSKRRGPGFFESSEIWMYLERSTTQTDKIERATAKISPLKNRHLA